MFFRLTPNVNLSIECSFHQDDIVPISIISVCSNQTSISLGNVLMNLDITNLLKYEYIQVYKITDNEIDLHTKIICIFPNVNSFMLSSH